MLPAVAAHLASLPRVLIADPPWQHGDQLPGPGRGASKHYQTMDTPAICSFQIPHMGHDALLFLWRVASMPREALEVVRAWRFEPKAELVWIKTAACLTCKGTGVEPGAVTRPCLECQPLGSGQSRERLRIGMGRYVRNAHETCIIAARGAGNRLIRDKSIPSVLFAPRARHSEKPEAFYRLVERLSAGPYLELFARRQRPGWDCRGLELGR